MVGGGEKKQVLHSVTSSSKNQQSTPINLSSSGTTSIRKPLAYVQSPTFPAYDGARSRWAVACVEL